MGEFLPVAPPACKMVLPAFLLPAPNLLFSLVRLNRWFVCCWWPLHLSQTEFLAPGNSLWNFQFQVECASLLPKLIIRFLDPFWIERERENSFASISSPSFL